MKKHNKKLLLVCAALLAFCMGFASCASPAAGEGKPDVGAAEADVPTVAAAQEPPAAPTEPAVATPPAAAPPTTSAMTTSPAAATVPAIAATTDGAVDGADKSKDKKKPDSGKDKAKKKKSSDKDKKKTEPAAPAKEQPKPADKTQPAPADDKITVSIAVDCLTLLADDPDLASQVSNKGIILAKKDVTVSKDATVYDVLKASGVSFAGKTYISSIGGLSEFDGGPDSGWVFLVGSKYAGVGVTAYTVKAGDAIKFRYTLNRGKDVQ